MASHGKHFESSEDSNIAARIRQRLADDGVFCLSLIGAPGSGKTSLIKRTLRALGERISMAVIAADVETGHDADYLRQLGIGDVHGAAVGDELQLHAHRILEIINRLDLDNTDALLIEHVGDLLHAPSLDIGEDKRAIILGVTQGDMAPLKYRNAFRNASVLLFNKIDLVRAADFDIEKAQKNAWNINPGLKTFIVSCRTTHGMRNWYTWFANQVMVKQSETP